MNPTARNFGGAVTSTLVQATVVAMDTGDWTIAAWVNPTGAGVGSAGQICNVSDSGGVSPKQLLRVNGSGMTIEVRQTYSTLTNCTTSTALSLNVWQLVVGIFRVSDLKCRCYVGSLAVPCAEASYSTNTSAAGTRTTAGSVANIGNNFTQSATWAGAIGPLVIDNREWSAADMEFFRQAGRPASFASLHGWWPLYGTGEGNVEPNLAGALPPNGSVLSPATPAFVAGPGLWVPRGATRSRGLDRV